MSSERGSGSRPPKSGSQPSGSGSQPAKRERSGSRPPKRGGAGGGRGAKERGGASQALEISAGGVVLRDDRMAVIVPTRRAPDGSRVLALPKGHVDPGETTLQAAEREVREETGVVVELISELGEVRYWYRRDGRTIPKSVTFYLFSYLSGDIEDHDDEVEEARWIGLKKAKRTLTHKAEREMVERALAYLEKDR
jgi:8-oxo-dGTP pyrophosphatase MutT (NUDIX family)